MTCVSLQLLEFGELPFSRSCSRCVQLTNLAPFTIAASWQLPELLPISPGPADSPDARMQPPRLLVSPMEALLAPYEQIEATITVSTGG